MVVRVMLLSLIFLAAPPVSVDKLIEELGSENFSTRENAEKSLCQAGRPVLKKIELAKSNKDLEISRRANRIYSKIVAPIFDAEAENTKKTTIKLIKTDKTGKYEFCGTVIGSHNGWLGYALTVSNPFESPANIAVNWEKKSSTCRLIKMDTSINLALVEFPMVGNSIAAISKKPLGNEKVCQAGYNWTNLPRLRIGECVSNKDGCPEIGLECGNGDNGAAIFHLEDAERMTVVGIILNRNNDGTVEHCSLETINEFLKNVDFKRR